LEKDIGEILGERFSQQAADILEDESLRAHRSYDLDRSRKHVPFIAVTAVLAPNRKRLAGGTTGNQLHTVLPLAEIYVADVGVEQTEMLAHESDPIRPQRLAGIRVSLNYHERRETRPVQTEGESATSRK
jgi:hypothetical protein